MWDAQWPRREAVRIAGIGAALGAAGLSRVALNDSEAKQSARKKQRKKCKKRCKRYGNDCHQDCDVLSGGDRDACKQQCDVAKKQCQKIC
jgi:hypothetical protein